MIIKESIIDKRCNIHASVMLTSQIFQSTNQESTLIPLANGKRLFGPRDVSKQNEVYKSMFLRTTLSKENNKYTRKKKS